MKKIFYYLAILMPLLVTRYTYGQSADQPIHIAIIPFTANGVGRHDITEAVQNDVLNNFANKDRFFLIDRGATEHIKRELDAAKDNASVYAKVVADQGHLANAEYIITGVVSPVDVQTTTNTYNGKTSYTYTATVRVALEMDKVETGRVFYNTPFNIQSVGSLTESAAVDNVLCKFGVQFKKIVRGLFSPSMTIIQVVKDKHGVPEKVRVNAGTEMFDSGKDDACGSVLSSIFSSKKKIWLEIYSEQDIVSGGKTYKTTHVIGTMKVDVVDGETSICDVSSGGGEIKALMDKGQPVLVRLQAGSN